MDVTDAALGRPWLTRRTPRSDEHKALYPRFFEIFFAKSPADRGGNAEAWLTWATGLADPSPVLHLSLQALVTSRVGAVDDNPALVERSVRLYSEAVSLLSRSLSLHSSHLDDQTVAASACLMMFEASAPSSLLVACTDSLC